MSRREGMDLMVLVPDLDLSGTVRCLLNRPESIGIRPVSFSVSRHLRRDAGCRTGAVERLREFWDGRATMPVFEIGSQLAACGRPTRRSHPTRSGR